MGIKISNSVETPALVYDNLFLESLDLKQTLSNSHGGQPHYVLKINYRLFAVDAENQRHYTTKTNSIIIDDYFSVAMQKAKDGDLDLIQAAGAIELALAQIIEDQTTLGTAEVVI
jgi:hypothetical protein